MSKRRSAGSTSHSPAYRKMPRPPRAVAATKKTRIQSTGRARCTARPPATPPRIGWRVSRHARRYGAGPVPAGRPGTGGARAPPEAALGGAVVIVTPCSHSDTRPTMRTNPGLTLRVEGTGAGRTRVVPDVIGRRDAPGWSHDHDTTRRPDRARRPPGLRRPRRPRQLRHLRRPPARNRGDAGYGPQRSREDLRDLGRLRRSVSDRKIAGVAGGLARHLDIDPVIVRVALVVLVFFGGAGLLIYGACWLFVPEEGAQVAPLGLDDRSRSIALVVAGVLAVLGSDRGHLGALRLLVADGDHRGDRAGPAHPEPAAHPAAGRRVRRRAGAERPGRSPPRARRPQAGRPRRVPLRAPPAVRPPGSPRRPRRTAIPSAADRSCSVSPSRWSPWGSASSPSRTWPGRRSRPRATPRWP